jgi:hypothetical protein
VAPTPPATSSPAAVSARAGSTLFRTPVGASPSGGLGGGAGSGGGATNQDATYNEILQRVHDEREQLGLLIQHPF